MNIINPSVTLIEEKNPFVKIELAGRTCYKSEANITDESAVKFYNNLVKRNHTAMLEHATFIFDCTNNLDVYTACMKQKFLNTTAVPCKDVYPFVRCIVSGNLRAINESGIGELLLALKAVDEKLVYVPTGNLHSNSGTRDLTVKVIDSIPNPTKEEINAHQYTTMRFICDRGVTHELVRHRLFSFAQESTRYCKYNTGINFIKPADFNNWTDSAQEAFKSNCVFAEFIYNIMMSGECTAQEARAVLPNSVKTEIIVTGNDKEWQHFFNLRSLGTTGKPHPDMKVVADMALELYKQKWEH